MSDEAEKAFDVWVSSERVFDADPRGQAHKAFMGGWHARDALIESLERLIAALTGSLQHVNIGWIRTLGQLAERDAVIESQERQIAALAGSIQDINTGWDETLAQLAERDAVIERVRGWVKSQEVDHSLHIHSTDSPSECTCGPSYESREARDVAKLLSASPSAVLAEHDARVLEETAKRVRNNATPPSELANPQSDRLIQWVADWIEKGAGQ